MVDFQSRDTDRGIDSEDDDEEEADAESSDEPGTGAESPDDSVADAERPDEPVAESAADEPVEDTERAGDNQEPIDGTGPPERGSNDARTEADTGGTDDGSDPLAPDSGGVDGAAEFGEPVTPKGDGETGSDSEGSDEKVTMEPREIVGDDVMEPDEPRDDADGQSGDDDHGAPDQRSRENGAREQESGPGSAPSTAESAGEASDPAGRDAGTSGRQQRPSDESHDRGREHAQDQSHDHGHGQTHDHGHGQTHDHPQERSHGHGNDDAQDQSHEHGTGGHDHSHEHGASGHDHSHEHEQDHETGGHDHSHEHAHGAGGETLRIAIVTVSSTRTLDDDPSGDTIQALLTDAGHEIATRDILRDDLDGIQSAVSALVDRRDVDAVVTTGGTGVTPDDVTIEAVEPLFDKELPGFGELFRILSYEDIGTKAVASRATAGVVDGVTVFCLPGSAAAAELGTDELIAEEIDHLVGLARRE